MAASEYQAILLVAFGGPEGPDDVLPFLENVLRGRNVPQERMFAVAEHYQRFGGKSPINAQNRALIAAIEEEFRSANIALPVYLGNRNWHPFLADTLRQMRDDGVRSALGLFTSAYSSYSSCRQYRENIEEAQRQVGAGAPRVDKLRAFFNHPGFIEAWIAQTREAFASLPPSERSTAPLIFTAHSIPISMAANCRYEAQLLEAGRLVAEALDIAPDRWRLAYQSRSGPPSQPWLEPGIIDCLQSLKTTGAQSVVVAPIGFISDHIEVLYDLDTEARGVAERLGLRMIRAKSLGTHPRFVQMIRELVVERLTGAADRPAVGRYAASHDACPADCCRVTSV
jgi:protoporphyrin/coproporphyrin ferrochelatase